MTSLDDVLSLSKQIGTGKACAVYKGELKTEDGTTVPVAVKFLKEDSDDEDSEEDETKLEAELKIQKSAADASVHVVRPIARGYYQNTPCTVSELADGISLFNYFTKKKVSVKKGKRIIKQIVRELRILNAAGVEHGDPHLNNIIVTKKSFKIIDFNMANELGDYFFSKGRKQKDLDANIFLYSVYTFARLFKTVAFSDYVRKALRPHVENMRRTMHKVPPSEWAIGTPILHKGKKERFNEQDWMGFMRFASGKSDIKRDEVLVDVCHEHIPYYFSHIDMPRFKINSI